MEQANFQGYAVIELMGHNREIGYVSTEYFGGPALFRIDQPELPAREYELKRAQWIGDKLCGVGTKVEREAVPGKTVYVGPQAIFRLTPCSKETAERGVDELIPAPIKILHLVEQKKIAATVEVDTYEERDLCPDCGRSDGNCECDDNPF